MEINHLETREVLVHEKEDGVKRIRGGHEISIIIIKENKNLYVKKLFVSYSLYLCLVLCRCYILRLL